MQHCIQNRQFEAQLLLGLDFGTADGAGVAAGHAGERTAHGIQHCVRKRQSGMSSSTRKKSRIYSANNGRQTSTMLLRLLLQVGGPLPGGLVLPGMSGSEHKQAHIYTLQT
jgi:hypothetical protein